MSRAAKRSYSANEQERHIFRWVYTRYRPWTPLDPAYGPELSAEIAQEVEDRFEGVVHHKLLDRVAGEIYDRPWVPRDVEVTWEDIAERREHIARRIAKSRHGSSRGDSFIREELTHSLKELSGSLDLLASEMGAVGHNASPLKNDEWRLIPQSIAVIREVVNRVQTNLQSHGSPDTYLSAADTICAEAKRNDRLHDRINVGADTFAREYGAQLGKNAANATTRFFYALLLFAALLVTYASSFFASVGVTTQNKQTWAKPVYFPG